MHILSLSCMLVSQTAAVFFVFFINDTHITVYYTRGDYYGLRWTEMSPTALTTCKCSSSLGVITQEV